MQRQPLLRKVYQFPNTDKGAKALQGEIMFADPYRLFPGGMTVYNPSWLVSRRGLAIYDKMRRDDQIKAALAFKKHAALASGWEVNTPEGMPNDWEISTFVGYNLRNITTDERQLDDILLEMLTALDFGYSCSEKVFKSNADGLIIEDIRTRHPHEIYFEQDEFGRLKQLQQQQSGGMINIPMNKVIIYTHGREFSNYYGVSDLEAAYRAWVVKDNAYKWLAMFLEKLGIPPVFALYNPQAFQGQVLKDLEQVIKSMQAATLGVIPRSKPTDLDFWSPQLGTQTQSVFVPALRMLNQDISRAILMPGLLGLTPDTESGSYARAKQHFDVFLLVVEYVRKTLAATIQNQVIKPLVDLNFGEQKEYPQFQFLPMTDEVRLDLLATWGNLTGQQVVTKQKSDEDHIRDILKFPDRQEGDEMPPPEPPPGTPGIPGPGAAPETGDLEAALGKLADEAGKSADQTGKGKGGGESGSAEAARVASASAGGAGVVSAAAAVAVAASGVGKRSPPRPALTKKLTLHPHGDNAHTIINNALAQVAQHIEAGGTQDEVDWELVKYKLDAVYMELLEGV